MYNKRPINSYSQYPCNNIPTERRPTARRPGPVRHHKRASYRKQSTKRKSVRINRPRYGTQLTRLCTFINPIPRVCFVQRMHPSHPRIEVAASFGSRCQSDESSVPVAPSNREYKNGRQRMHFCVSTQAISFLPPSALLDVFLTPLFPLSMQHKVIVQ